MQEKNIHVYLVDECLSLVKKIGITIVQTLQTVTLVSASI